MHKLKLQILKECKKRTEGTKTNVCLKGSRTVWGAGMNCCQPQQFWPCAMTQVSFWCDGSLYQ